MIKSRTMLKAGYLVLLLGWVGWVQAQVALTPNNNPSTTSFGQVQRNTLCGSVTITHSVDPVTITPNNSVSCNAGGLHTDNSYFRAFDLNAFGILGTFNVCEVEIGIETAAASLGGTQPLTVNLFTSNGAAFPGGTLTPIGTGSFNVTDQALTLSPFSVTGSAPAGSELVVEIFTPDGQSAGHSFFIGSNANGETDPSYLEATACGDLNPMTAASLGFPNMNIVMSVHGDDQGVPIPTLAPLALVSLTLAVAGLGTFRLRKRAG